MKVVIGQNIKRTATLINPFKSPRGEAITNEKGDVIGETEPDNIIAEGETARKLAKQHYGLG